MKTGFPKRVAERLAALLKRGLRVSGENRVTRLGVETKVKGHTQLKKKFLLQPHSLRAGTRAKQHWARHKLWVGVIIRRLSWMLRATKQELYITSYKVTKPLYIGWATAHKR